MKIIVASDHAGFILKEKVVSYLKEAYDVVDIGCYSEESVDYPDFAHPLAEAVSSGECNFGIAICGTGNGMNMTVNKHKYIRGALCRYFTTAYLARKHNDANVCCLPAWDITIMEAYRIVDNFLSTEFEGGRHQRRVDNININIK